MKFRNIRSNIKQDDDEFKALQEFTKELAYLNQFNFQLYEYIGRLLLTAYRHCFLIDHFGNDGGALTFTFTNGEDAEYKRDIRIEVDL